jgi:hypothetical protein
VRFVEYIPAVVRGAKINWDADVELSPEVRQAMRPYDVEPLRRGRLRRPFHIKPARPGTRGRPIVREEIEHPKGALVFATEDDTFFWFEAPEHE